MRKRETFREYFRRARHDAGVRAHLLETCWQARTAMGWVAVCFAVLAVGPLLYTGIRHGVWMSNTAIFCAISCVINLFIWDKFGDRIIALESMDDEQEPPESGVSGDSRG